MRQTGFRYPSGWATSEDFWRMGLAMMSLPQPPKNADGYYMQVAARLAEKGDMAAKGILQEYAKRYSWAQAELPQVLKLLASSGDETALVELENFPTMTRIAGKCTSQIFSASARLQVILTLAISCEIAPLMGMAMLRVPTREFRQAASERGGR